MSISRHVSRRITHIMANQSAMFHTQSSYLISDRFSDKLQKQFEVEKAKGDDEGHLGDAVEGLDVIDSDVPPGKIEGDDVPARGRGGDSDESSHNPDWLKDLSDEMNWDLDKLAPHLQMNREMLKKELDGSNTYQRGGKVFQVPEKWKYLHPLSIKYSRAYARRKLPKGIIRDMYKSNPNFDWKQFKMFRNDTKNDVIERVSQQHQNLVMIHHLSLRNKARKDFLKASKKVRKLAKIRDRNPERAEERWSKYRTQAARRRYAHLRLKTAYSFRSKRFNNHIQELLLGHAKQQKQGLEKLPLRPEHLVVKNPRKDIDQVLPEVVSNLDMDTIPLMNKYLKSPYHGLPYLYPSLYKKIKARYDMHMNNNDPLPDDLKVFHDMINANPEKKTAVESQQYINKLVPNTLKPNDADPMHPGFEDYANEFNSARSVLRRALKRNQRRLNKELRRVRRRRGSPNTLPLRWRAAYRQLIANLRDEVQPNGDWKKARDTCRTILSTFSHMMNLDKHCQYLHLYLTGHAKYWDWNKAREFYMKHFKTMWNPHGKTRDKSLRSFRIMMKGLAYRNRSFDEVLALHSLIADETANGRHFTEPIPPVDYFNSILRVFIEEENWELAKKWYIHFFKTTLYNRRPSNTAQVVPNTRTHTLMLMGASKVPKIAPVEAHMIMDAARRDSIKHNSTFDMSPEMLLHLMKAHINVGDGEGAVTAFKRAFETPFSSGPVQLFSLHLQSQRELLLLYFHGLALKRDMDEIYQSLTALYHYDYKWMDEVHFHNKIMAKLATHSYSHGIHFFKHVFRIKGRVHVNPVHPNFYTFETIMSKAVNTKRFMLARGLVNMIPPQFGDKVSTKLKNMSGLALGKPHSAPFQPDEL